MISTIKSARRNDKNSIHNLYELRAELDAFPVFLELSWFWTSGGRHIEFICFCETGGEMTYAWKWDTVKELLGKASRISAFPETNYC